MIETPVAHSSLPADSALLDGVELSAAPAIITTGPGRDFGKMPVLHDVNLSIAKGRVCALLGPNGAGKTTLLKLCSEERHIVWLKRTEYSDARMRPPAGQRFSRWPPTDIA
jgi:ABC-type glutathione transport system ATPase component